MKVNLQFFKQGGKWYADAEVEIPDETNLWDDNLYPMLLEKQDQLVGGEGFICVVNISEKEADRLDKFFTCIIHESIDQNKTKGVSND